MVMVDGAAAGRRRAQGSSGRAGALMVTACREAVLVLLIGDLGIVEARQLSRRLRRDLLGEPTNIIVDASAATWLCDELIAVLREAARRAEDAQGELVVVDPSPALQLQLRGSGLRARTTCIGASDQCRHPGSTSSK